METALAYRPGHPLLLGYVAYLAAETGDPALALAAANSYADLGLVPGADIRAALEKALPGDAWQNLQARFDANAAAVGTAQLAASLPDSLRLVEGIAASADGTLYFGTIVSRALYARASDGQVRKIFDGAAAGLGSFFGLAYQEGRGLFATFATIDETPGIAAADSKTGLLLLDPATGQVLGQWTLPGTSENAQVADVTITASGSVFVSDAKGKAVYRLEGEGLVPAYRHPGFMSPQGIAEDSAGHLVLADYGRGLWLLNTGSGEPTLIEVPAGTSLVGIDGLARHGDRLVAIQNGVNPQRLVTIRLSADGRTVADATILAQALPDFDEPTLGTSRGGTYYFVAASHWPSFAPGGVLKDGAKPAPTAILSIRD
ncbi:MAG: hypothetical protein EP335_09355 [Alphaproteobacteria bacterium]|nr:MAG: hypothetical protein EP335_09355 [Alphaproteobacteria bacterium]